MSVFDGGEFCAGMKWIARGMEAKGNERRARLWSCETYTGGEEGSKEGGMEWKGRQTINIINKDSHGLPITTKSGLYYTLSTRLIVEISLFYFCMPD